MIRLLLSVALFLAIGTALQACEPKYSDQVNELSEWLRDHPIGSSPDYWLVKRNAFGDLDRVAVVFGYMDDAAGCADIADLLHKKYERANYSCMPANLKE